MSRRVAMVVSTTAAESGATLAARLRHLLDNGWDARLFCKGEVWARQAELRDPAISERVELKPKAARDSSPFDGRLLELRPDLVHFHSGWAGWKGMHGVQRLQCRVVISFRDDGQDLAVADPERLWESADLLLFPSAGALERALVQGWPRERAEVLHAPVTHVDRHEQELEPEFLRILSAGSLVWEQGFEHSVHAVRLLLDMGVRCEYRIVGEGDHLPAVAFARHQLGLKDDVALVAPNGGDPLAGELRAADVFVDPAVADTTSPSGLLSAQARGLPFVATRRAGLPDDAGIEVPRRNPRAIAEALAVLAADPALRVRMGRAGRRMQGIPTLEDHVADLENLYRRVLAGDRR
jgi:glycosyltransferase involved in cell wall biosynthesis